MSDIEEMIIRHEGLRLKAYKCPSGKTTIGYGRNLDDAGITEGEAIYLLRGDILRVKQQLATSLTWTTGLDQVRNDVLLDMAFNMGIASLLKFTSTLKAVKDHRWEDAYVEMLNSRWAKQVKGRAYELAKMMLTGKRLPDVS